MTKTPATLAQVEQALKQAWRKETSSDPGRWTAENPAWGQCAVTACVVQNYFGGVLVRTAMPEFGENFSHYWNRLSDGATADFTRCQFPEGTTIPQGERRTRVYVLSYPQTRTRYYELKKRVVKAMRYIKKKAR